MRDAGQNPSWRVFAASPVDSREMKAAVPTARRWSAGAGRSFRRRWKPPDRTDVLQSATPSLAAFFIQGCDDNLLLEHGSGALNLLSGRRPAAVRGGESHRRSRPTRASREIARSGIRIVPAVEPAKCVGSEQPPLEFTPLRFSSPRMPGHGLSGSPHRSSSIYALVCAFVQIPSEDNRCGNRAAGDFVGACAIWRLVSMRAMLSAPPDRAGPCFRAVSWQLCPVPAARRRPRASGCDFSAQCQHPVTIDRVVALWPRHTTLRVIRQP